MKLFVAFLIVCMLAMSVFAAPSVQDSPTSTDPPKPERKCVEGKRYHDGCNQCWCTPAGFTACTYKACVSFRPDGTIAETNRIEPPADYWRPE